MKQQIKLQQTLMILAVVLSMAFTAAAEDPTFDNWVYSESPLDSYESYADQIKEVGTVNIRFDDGRTYIKYNSVFTRISRTTIKPDIKFIEPDVLLLDWKANRIPGWIDTHDMPSMINLSFDLEFEGEIRVMPYVKSNDKLGIEPYIVESCEGTDITLPIEREVEGFGFANLFKYGFVKDGRLTGEFVTEYVDRGKIELDGKQYYRILRCNSDVFDKDAAETIGYIRCDGFRYMVYPIDKDLDFSMWTDAVSGSFNPYKEMDGREYCAYEMFPVSGTVVFHDFILGRSEMSPILKVADEWQHCFYNLREPAKFQPYCALVRRNRLANGAEMREDLGFFGAGCVNSFIYPSMAGGEPGQSRLRLISAESPRFHEYTYVNEDLEAQYQSLKTGVTEVEMPDMRIRYADGIVTVEGCDSSTIRIYSADGRLTVADADGAAGVSTETLASGIYIVKAIAQGESLSTSIAVK